MKSEEDIIQVIQEDKWIMDILKAAKSLELADWWVCAGFIRSKIWDVLHGFAVRTPLPDIDVIYYDKSNIDEQAEKQLDEQLRHVMPNLPWSVKNQARMHIVNKIPPYSSAVDAISKFPETVTALGIKLDDNDKVVLTAPHGIHDLINLQVRPTPYFCETKDRAKIYEERIVKKNWKRIWTDIHIVHLTNAY
jgi:uncharacterized protein